MKYEAWCSDCKQYKDRDQFYLNTGRRPLGLCGRCKDCQAYREKITTGADRSEYQRRYRLKQKELND